MGGPQNRLLLALQSNLPNEVDWAFSKLIKLSCSFPPNFHVGSIAGLIDAIIAHADPFFENLKLNTAVDNFETSPDSSRPESLQLLPHFSEITLFNLRDAHELLDRVLQVLHVLRNFSFTDIHIKFLIQQHKVLTLLAKSLALPTADCSLYAPVKHHSLDVFENLSVHIQLRGRHDFYLACLRKIVVESMDRALLLGALRSLTRLCGNDANHPHLSDMDPRVLERAWALVCLRPASTSTAAGTPAAGIDDAEIVYVALEFCYLFSCLGVDAVAMVVQAARPANIVGVLLGFLGWNRPDIRPRKRRAASQLLLPHLQQATPATAASTPALVPGATANPSLATAPTVPSMTVPSQAGIPQAGKFATASGGKPAKRSSVKGEDEEVDIDGDEEELVEEGRVDLGVHGDRQVANFLQQSQMSQSADGFAVESVKKRRGRPPKRSDDPYAAAAQQQLLMQQQHQMMMMQQRNPGPPASQDSLFSQPLGSFSRNGAVAVAADDEFEEEDEPQADPLFECRWVAAASGSQQCTAKFGSEVEMLQHLAKEHFKAESAASAAEKFSCRWAGCTAFHSFPASRADVFCHSRTHIGDSSKKLKTFSQSAVKKPFRTGGVDGVDPIGSPLTALLILKNIARSQRMRDLFLPFEADLALAMTERPKFSKIVAELMWELR
ncbi:Chromatin structure-remodeling complex protein rsc9 [Entophlyctis luteolus]|nr:Chromatin structure-remodeling complex protein rsc9 [Entophlyctis luteolus]